MNIRVIAVPLLVIGMLQLSGCVPGSRAVTPGGAYLSKSAGANFDQSVAIQDSTETIARFSLGNSFRAVEKPGSIYMAAGARGIVVSDNSGETWRVVAVPLSQTLDIVVLGNGVWVAAGRDKDGQGYIVRSLDQGKSWDSVLTVPIPVKTSRLEIISEDVVASVVLSLERDPFNSDRLYAGNSLGTILVGEQSAKVWKTMYTLRAADTEFLGAEQALAIQRLLPSPVRSGELLLITATGSLIRIRDGKQTEITIPRNLEVQPEGAFTDTFNSRRVLDVSYVPGFPQALMVATSTGALVTRDDAKTWVELKLPIDASRGFNRARVAISPTNPNRLLVAINNVIYRSEDSGSSWNTFDFGLDNFYITDFLIDPSNASQVLAILQPVGL